MIETLINCQCSVIMIKGYENKIFIEHLSTQIYQLIFHLQLNNSF